MKNNKVIVGFSGGADSAAAALILKSEGYEVTGVTFNFFGDEKLLERAQRLSEHIGIAHECVDKRQAFKEKVIDSFVRDYLSGYTPNPCVRCDAEMKFSGLMACADACGAGYIATGHYLKIEKGQGRVRVRVSQAAGKDQSYYLYTLTQECLKRLIFPLGDFESKSQVRSFLRERGVAIPESEESQGICFIPDGNYARFLKKKLSPMPPGRFRDSSGKILGSHPGFYHYTLGQKRGISLISDKKYTVVGLRPETNEVILGGEEDLCHRRIFLRDLHFIDGAAPAGKIFFKVCRWGYLYQGTLFLLKNDRAYIDCDEDVRAPMPGQAAVFYDGDVLLGGGTIEYKQKSMKFFK